MSSQCAWLAPFQSGSTIPPGGYGQAVRKPGLEIVNPVRHTSHPKVISRLKRAQGHLAHVIGMLEAEEPCVDIVQQLHAVEKAVTNAKRALIHDHIDHCLAPEDAGDTAEFKAITKYL